MKQEVEDETEVDVDVAGIATDSIAITTKARVISHIDFDSKTFHLTTQDLSYDVRGFSHRWKVQSANILIPSIPSLIPHNNDTIDGSLHTSSLMEYISEPSPS